MTLTFMPRWLRKLIDQQSEILRIVKSIKEGQEKIMYDLKTLTDAVTAEKTVEDSAIALLGNLSTQLQAAIAGENNSVDPAKIQQIIDSINTNKAALAAAITANTPAAPPAPPAPAPAQ